MTDTPDIDNSDSSDSAKSAYVIPQDAEWTEPCPGSVGSKPHLEDVQAQLAENQSAAAEHRKAQPIAIHCGFCGGYHLEMQPPVETLVGGEYIPDYSPPPVEPPKSDPEEVAYASSLVVNEDNAEGSDSDTEDDNLDDIFPNEPDSSSGSSDSSSR